MQTINDISRYPGLPSAVCVGVFDGVHLGHRSLISRLVADAKARGLASVVVTFDPHPRIVLSKGNDRVGILTTPSEREQELAQTGVDFLVVIPFTREFSDLTARQFLAEVLVAKLNARYMLLGYNHHFGSDDVPPSDYPALAKSLGIEAAKAEAFLLPNNVKVSSTEIRNALAAGDVAAAADLLGRHYSLEGEVVHGDAVGRKLGFRTANIVPANQNKLIPADGVYACRVSFQGSEPHVAVVNVGTRPTLGGDDRRIEAHVLDFDGDLYGGRATLLFVARIREERKFANLDELSRQIASDIETAKADLKPPR